MDKDFVKYEIALKLDEIGFDEPCWFPYNEQGEICYNEYVFHNIIHDRYDFKIFDKHNIHYMGIKAPTLSQVSKWLREKHGIDIVPMPNWIEIKIKVEESCKVYGYILFKYGMETIYNVDNHRNYEEALEAGIIKALELIVKQHENKE